MPFILSGTRSQPAAGLISAVLELDFDPQNAGLERADAFAETSGQTCRGLDPCDPAVHRIRPRNGRDQDRRLNAKKPANQTHRPLTHYRCSP